VGERRGTLLGSDSAVDAAKAVEDLVDPLTGLYSLRRDFDDFFEVHRTKGHGGLGQLVAVVDSGIDTNHPVLSEHVIDSKDFTSDGTDQDEHGHGTLVALVIRWAAPKALLLNAKAFSRNGTASERSIADALAWAHDREATVVNLSGGIGERDAFTPFLDRLPRRLRRILSGGGRTSALLNRLRGHWLRNCRVCSETRRLAAANIFVCTAVGNDRGTVYCPAREPRAFAIGSSRRDGENHFVAEYSGYWPDFLDTELPVRTGTSFSVPFTSALLCLMHEATGSGNPSLLPFIAETSGERGCRLFDRRDPGAFSILTQAVRQDPHIADHLNDETGLADCRYCSRYGYPVLMRLAFLLLWGGEQQRALELFEYNTRMVPTFADAHSNLGACYRELGMLEQSLQAYLEATRLNPSSSTGYEGLAVTYVERGAKALAIDAYRRALDLDPNRLSSLQDVIPLLEEAGITEEAGIYRARLSGLDDRPPSR
jgi:hypothetical protein